MSHIQIMQGTGIPIRLNESVIHAMTFIRYELYVRRAAIAEWKKPICVDSHTIE